MSHTGSHNIATTKMIVRVLQSMTTIDSVFSLLRSVADCKDAMRYIVHCEAFRFTCTTTMHMIAGSYMALYW